MAQADYNVANQSGASFRADLNNQLAAIVSNNSGASEPSTTYAYQWWADTTSGKLKLRNAANSAWIEIVQLDGEWTNLALENGTAAAPPLYFKDSGTDTGLFSGGTDQVNVSTAGTERVEFGTSAVVFNDGGNNYDFRVEGDTNANLLFVDASADKVGIGTASPGVALHVNGDIRCDGIYGEADTNTSIQFPGSDVITFNEGGSEAARIDSSGRLGIGTTSPVTQCTVYGSTSAIQFQNTNTGSASGDGFYVGNYGGISAAVWQYENDVMLFGTNNTERARINEYGNVIINAPSGYAYPGLYIKGGSTSSAEYPFVSQNSSGSNILVLRNNTYVDSPGIYNLTTTSAANVFISAAGTLARSTSSIKYKADVETLEDSYADAILNIRPVWYRSIAGEDNRDWGYWGFIAEEVYEVDPRLTFLKTEEQTVDENGLPSGTVPLDEPEVEGVQYDRFVPHLVNLIKRQRDQIEALEARVAALEGA